MKAEDLKLCCNCKEIVSLDRVTCYCGESQYVLLGSVVQTVERIWKKDHHDPRQMTFGSTPYPGNQPGHQRGNDTSQAAAVHVKKNLGQRQFDVLREIVRVDNATSDHICVRLNRLPNQISGRFTELKNMGYIYDIGLRRKTRTGCIAKVWALTADGWSIFRAVVRTHNN
jgi:hypothetical protein